MDSPRELSVLLVEDSPEWALIAEQRLVRELNGVRPGDTVAHFGGDEFMLLCDDIVSEEDAVAVADRLGAELELPFEVGGLDLTVGASIGIAVAHDRGRAPAALVREADRSMYAAKRRGARWELASAEHDEDSAMPAAIEAVVQSALPAGSHLP